jgi:hypothetical protein
MAVSGPGDKVVAAGDGITHVECIYEAHRSQGTWTRVFNPQPQNTGEQARSVDVTTDGTLAVIGMSDGRIRMWRPDDTLDPVGAYRETGGEVWGATFTRDGSQVVAASRDGMLFVVPACTWCGSNRSLADDAERILARARGFGLTDH